ncbi:hypothetical protein FRC10_001109 [Ceratobasidium sp. 414]|nr:hypothetical protein FRC10_001109 [Ceratobasidium sp. 414]
MVWTLLRTEAGFTIQYEEEDSVVNLHHASAVDGNVVSGQFDVHLLLCKSGDCPPHRRWKFEHISDDTGGEIDETIENEVDCLKRELGEKNAQLALQTEELTKKDQQLAEKDRMLVIQAAALHQMGSPACTAGKMAEVYGKLERIEREVRAMMDGFGVENVQQASLYDPNI